MRAGVLFVSPHSEDADRLSQILGPLPVELDHVADLEHARHKLRQEPYPVILTDADLPDGAGPMSWIWRRVSPRRPESSSPPVSPTRACGSTPSAGASSTFWRSRST